MKKENAWSIQLLQKNSKSPEKIVTSIYRGKVASVGRSVIKNFMFLCSTMTGPGPCKLLPWLGGTRVPEGIFISDINYIYYKCDIFQGSVKLAVPCCA